MNFLLCAIAKCENKYILEWVQWHLKLGFNKIVIYDNNDPEGERISDTIGNLAGVEIVDWRGRKQASCETQVAAYNDCYKKHLDVEWIFFLDIDEFLEFKEGVSLKSFFMNVWTKNANVIKFHWKCYGDSGYIDEQNGLVTETYKELCTDRNTNLNTKSAYRGGLENLKILNVHYCNDVGKIYYQSGAVCKNPCSTTDNNINYDNGWVRHYVTKSLEEFVKIKFARRNPGTSKTRLNSSFYFKYNKRTPEKEQKLKDLIMLYDNNVKVTPDNTPKEKPQNTNWWERMEPVKKPSVYDLQNKRQCSANKNNKNICNYSIDELVLKKGDEKIIVSFTSWKKRIHLCSNIVDTMLMQTLQPDKIILNLSTDEFVNKEKDLPEELVKKQSDIFEINWVKENTKVYKKVLPIFDRFPNDAIISIDDDIDYPLNCIQIMYSYYISNNRNYPVTSGTYKWNDRYSHYGGFSLIRRDMIQPYFDDLYKNVVLKYGFDTLPFADPVFTYAVLLNNKKYVCTDTLNMSAIRARSINDKKDRVSNIGTVEYEKTILKEHTLLRDYIFKKYGKTYDDLTKDKVIVSFTTWKKRHDCAAIMLDWFKQQTIKPDKIICWLSSDEYDGENIPQSLQKFVNEKYIEVRWIKENTYCHKRYEVFKEHKDDYVFLIDDDIYYEPNYIQLMYDAAKKHPQNIICYTGYKIEYEKDRILLNIKENPSIKNTILSGLSCYPPNVFPVEYFANVDIRDKISPKCDDSFLTALAIKNNIQIFCIYDRKQKSFRTISQYQNVGIWEENKVVTNGVMKRTQIFKNLIKAFHLENECKKIWNTIVL